MQIVRNVYQTENMRSEQYFGTVYISIINVNNRMNFATRFFLDVFGARVCLSAIN